MYIYRGFNQFVPNYQIFNLDLSKGWDPILIYNLLWTIGFTLLIITVGYTLGLYDETEDKSTFKIPKDVIVLFIIGLIIFIASFYIPIPIIHQ